MNFKPIAKIHSYKASYKLNTYLSEPLWGCARETGTVAADACALLSSLECLLTANIQDNKYPTRRTDAVPLETRVDMILTKLRSLSLPGTTSVGDPKILEFMRSHDIDTMFPAVTSLLEGHGCRSAGPGPDRNQTKLNSYWGCCSAHFRVLVVARQLSRDVRLPELRKYAGHGLALLYTALKPLAGTSAAFRRWLDDVERNFEKIRDWLDVADPAPDELDAVSEQNVDWVVRVCEGAEEEAKKYLPTVTVPLAPLLATIVPYTDQKTFP